MPERAPSPMEQARRRLASTTFDPTLRQLMAELFAKEAAAVVADRALADAEQQIASLESEKAELRERAERLGQRISQLEQRLDELDEPARIRTITGTETR